MAKWCVPLVLISGLCLLAGCQPQSGNSTVLDTMPAPSFTGPVMLDDAHPAYAMASVPPQVTIVAPRPAIISPIRHGSHGESPMAWVPAVKANSWHWIVIHHSATTTGGAAAFDKMHKAKGWDELGYHFVIGNGTDTRDGQTEVGSRWPKQKWGAHTKTPDNQFNEHGIGICLVGNFDVSHPTEAQLGSLSKLVAYLMKTYHISADHVVGHRDCKSTDCPGRYISIARVRQLSIQILADAGDPVPQEPHHAILARGEMLQDAKPVVAR